MPGPAGLVGLVGLALLGWTEQGLCVSPEVPLGTAALPAPPWHSCLIWCLQLRPGWGSRVASWPVCLTRAPPSLHAAPLGPTVSRIGAFPAAGLNASTASSPSQPFPPPDPALPHIPHGPLLPVHVTLIPLLQKPLESLGIQPRGDIPTEGAPRAPVLSLWTSLSVLTSPGPAAVPAACHRNGADRSRQDRAKAQPFLCGGCPVKFLITFVSQNAHSWLVPCTKPKGHLLPRVSRFQQSQARLSPLPAGSASSQLLSCAGLCTCG